MAASATAEPQAEPQPCSSQLAPLTTHFRGSTFNQVTSKLVTVMGDTFNQLPLTFEPASKSLTTTTSVSPIVTEELAQLNALHKQFLTLSNMPAPPPPLPVDPRRSAQITKLRESGNTAFKQQKYNEAINLYSLGLRMALDRPVWEPSGLIREESSGLYANRAQAYMAERKWVEGAADAECSVELKKVGNAKAWWRRGKCLLEMGRYEEAKEWIENSLEFEAEEKDLQLLLKDIEAKLGKRAV
jgi:translocation protein SEC72